MTAFHVRVFEGGKIVIPAAVRRKDGFDVGSTLVVEDTPQGVTIRSLEDAVASAQAIMARVAPADRVSSDELIAERRAEAAAAGE
jgi:bifunctional DNA-binding transcriptional regulator/antitoxin component of YhaV-PrlF toxin-antitoxin module